MLDFGIVINGLWRAKECAKYATLIGDVALYGRKV
jgi:hypothetical protein